MQLFSTTASPFVRKVLVAAHELDLASRLTLIEAAAHPIQRNATVVAHNPLGKIPTLITDDGMALYDSRVICAYLDSLNEGGPKLFPQGKQQFQVLIEQAAADGLIDAGILIRYEEVMRPESQRSKAWTDGQQEKIFSVLDQLERWAPQFGERHDIGMISVGCAIGWLEFRFPALSWRERCPTVAVWWETFSRRRSMLETAPR